MGPPRPNPCSLYSRKLEPKSLGGSIRTSSFIALIAVAGGLSMACTRAMSPSHLLITAGSSQNGGPRPISAETPISNATTALITEPHAPGTLVLQPGSTVSADQVNAALTALGLAPGAAAGPEGALAIAVPESQLGQAVEALQGTGLFNAVEPDYLAKVAQTPNDPLLSTEWHLQKIEAPAAWDHTTGDKTVEIAVIDTGINDHVELTNRIRWADGRCLGCAGPVFLDSGGGDGHGTAVAGVIAAQGNNTIGIAGLDWAAGLMPVRVADVTGFAPYSAIAAAIQYAADRGARVINVSLGGSGKSTLLDAAVDYAWDHGAVVVAAAMNEASAKPMYPAACAHAISVAATDTDDTVAPFSTFGSWVTVGAPGVAISTLSADGGYKNRQGTSFAAPLVSGALALAIAIYPRITPSMLKQLLKDHSDPVLPTGKHAFGRLNVRRLLEGALALKNGDIAPPALKAGVAHATTCGANGGVPCFGIVDSGNHRVQLLDDRGFFLRAFGTAGTAPGQLQAPTGIARAEHCAPAGGAGCWAVADPATDRVQLFDDWGTYLKTFSTVGIPDRPLNHPTGVAFADHCQGSYDGPCWAVTDTGNDRIVLFFDDGSYMFSFGITGRIPGRFWGPTGIAHGERNSQMSAAWGIADAGNQRVQFFDSYGFLQGQMKSPQGFTAPSSVTWSSLCGNYQPNSPCWAAVDAGGRRVQMFDGGGVYQREFLGYPTPPDGIAAAPSCARYGGMPCFLITDTFNHHATFYDGLGLWGANFGTRGSGDGEYAF